MKAIIENGKINDGIRNDHYIIKLNAIVLAVEKGDESLDIRAEW